MMKRNAKLQIFLIVFITKSPSLPLNQKAEMHLCLADKTLFLWNINILLPYTADFGAESEDENFSVAATSTSNTIE